MDKSIKIEVGQVWGNTSSMRKYAITMDDGNFVGLGSVAKLYSYDQLEAGFTLYRNADGTLASPEPTADVDERERARDYYRRRAEDMRPVMTQEEAFGIEVKPTAAVEGLSERDRWFYNCGRIDGQAPTILGAPDHVDDAPPSDSQAEGCRCPCHSEGLWKLPDEITRLKKVVDGYHETLKATKAELDTWIGRAELLYRMLPFCGVDRQRYSHWFDKHGKAIRPQENEDV